MCLYRPTSPPNPRWAPPLHFSPPLFSPPPPLLSSPLYWVVCRGEWRGRARTQGMYRVGEEQVVTVERLAGGLGGGCWRNSWWGEVTCIHTQSFKSSLNQQQVLKKPSGDRFSQECICLAASVMVIMYITMQKSAFFMKTSRNENLEISEKLCLCVLLLVLFVAKRCRVYCLGTDERRKKKRSTPTWNSICVVVLIALLNHLQTCFKSDLERLDSLRFCRSVQIKFRPAVRTRA